MTNDDFCNFLKRIINDEKLCIKTCGLIGREAGELIASHSTLIVSRRTRSRISCCSFGCETSDTRAFTRSQRTRQAIRQPLTQECQQR